MSVTQSKPQQQEREAPPRSFRLSWRCREGAAVKALVSEQLDHLCVCLYKKLLRQKEL